MSKQNGAISTPVVLYVEDDDFSVEMFQLSLDETDADLKLVRVHDAEEGLAYLLRNGVYRDAPVPKLVILDLNLPGMGGLELLEKLRDTDALKEQLVVMFTASEQRSDREQARALGVHDFYHKSSDWEECLDFARSVQGLVSHEIRI